jgi:hypothetical protein
MRKPTINLIETLFNQSKEYAQNRFNLYKLKVVDKSASAVSAIVLGIALFVIFFIFFVVLNIGIGLLIGSLVGHVWLGFLILAAFYAIVGIILFAGRNKIIKTPITAMIFRKFL